MIDVRDHLTERLTTGRVKLEAKRSRKDFAILLLGAGIALLGAAYILSHVASTLVRSSHKVAFEVESARAVRPGLNEVRVKGVPAGRISGVKVSGGHAIVTVDIEDKYGDVYRDAKAELRPNSALEDQFLDIVDRGHKAAGVAKENDPLPSSQTTVPVSVDDVLSVFNGNTRARMRHLLADLGTGLNDNGQQLADAFVAATPLLKAAERLTQQLAARRPMTEHLVRNTGILTAELARRDGEIRALVRNGSATLGTLSAGSADLDSVLRQLPGTLAQADTSFTATRGVLGDVNTAVRALMPVAGRLDPALSALRSLAREAAPAVSALQTPVTKLVPLSRSLRPLSSRLSASIARLRPQIDTVNQLTKDLAGCRKGIQGFFQWDASMTKFGDSRGQAPRGTLAVGLQSAGLASPEESAYQGCTPGGPIPGRVPTAKDER
jgi:virulence factor Mce-like protein